MLLYLMATAINICLAFHTDGEPFIKDYAVINGQAISKKLCQY
jgi:hypothetical protein